jgi:hypothetical protein
MNNNKSFLCIVNGSGDILNTLRFYYLSGMPASLLNRLVRVSVRTYVKVDERTLMLVPCITRRIVEITNTMHRLAPLLYFIPWLLRVSAVVMKGILWILILYNVTK